MRKGGRRVARGDDGLFIPRLSFVFTVVVLPPRIHDQRFISVEKSHARKSVLDLSERERRENGSSARRGEAHRSRVVSFLLPSPALDVPVPPSSLPYTILPSRRPIVVEERGEPLNERRGRMGRSDRSRHVNEEVKLREATTKIRRGKAYDQVDVLLNEELGRRGNDRQL